MAELVNGTYAIISVSSSLALDVGSVKSKTISLTQPEISNSQLWSLINENTVYLDDVTLKNTWLIKSKLNGMMVSPDEYVSISGAAIVQNNYDLNDYEYADEEDPDTTDDSDSGDEEPDDGDAEEVEYDDSYDNMWIIEDSGTTASYDGDTYSAYTVRRVVVPYSTGQGTLTTAMAMFDVDEDSDDDPSIKLADYSATDTTQRWLFIPFSNLSEDGLYTIRTAQDPNVGLTVGSASTANNASIKIGSISDATNQQFKIQKYGNYYRFVAYHSNKAMDIKNNSAVAKADILQHTINQSNFNTSTVTMQSTYTKDKKGKKVLSGVQKANLGYSISSTSTVYTVNVNRMNFETTFKSGLPNAVTLKAKLKSISVTPTTGQKAGLTQKKGFSKGAAKKGATGQGFALSKTSFGFTRGSSAKSCKIVFTLSTQNAAYLGVTTTKISAGSKTKKLSIDGATVTVSKNKIVTYSGTKYIFNGKTWAKSKSGVKAYTKDVTINITIPKTSSGIDVTDDSQLWKVVNKASVEYAGTVYQTYEIQPKASSSVVVGSGTAKANQNVSLESRNNTNRQRFIFARTVVSASDIQQPTEIRERLFDRTGNGAITVTGLTFQSTYSSFMARYKVRNYTSSSKYTDSSWMNVEDNSTARSGWGQTGTPTFSYTPVNGIITIPFTKTCNLTATVKSIDLIFEICAFVDSYGTAGYPAKGPVRQSTVSLVQKPTMSVRSLGIFADTTANSIGIQTVSQDSLNEGCQILRGRLLGNDGEAISDWVSKSEMSLFHSAADTLYRFPNEGETISFEYSMLAKNGSNISGIVSRPFSFRAGPVPTIEYSTDDSCTATVTVNTAASAFCLFSIPDIDLDRIYIAEKISVTTTQTKWIIVPPINIDFDVYVFTSTDNIYWTYSRISGRINSHLFIWNWTSDGSTVPFNEYTSIIVNNEAPPQQTRSFTTGIQFSKPIARRHPVGFSDFSVDTTLNIEGTVIDDDASYVAAGPLPQHSSTSYLSKLVSLGGLGIHPIYRTPYGDWYTVAIEQLDLSKTDVGFSKASVTQRAVKD